MKEVFENIVEKLEEKAIFYNSASDVDQSIRSGIITAKEIVQEAATEYNNGWIPCSERLPETDEYILLSFENFTIADIGRYEIDEEGNGAFYPGDEDKSYASFGLFVNAWQPLPAPYQEEGESNGSGKV
ncbi:MAG: DUF551 domain-containing protein [Lachnospiraceae bacterium]